MTVHQIIHAARGASAAIDVERVSGFADAIDDVAARAATPHRFLRRAWYRATGSANATTIVARRLDGTPILALPTTPLGPDMVGARAIPGIYWPYRAPVIAADADPSELAAALAHPNARGALSPFWRLGPTYADDPSIGALVAAARRAGWWILTRPLGRVWNFDLAAAVESGFPRKSVARRLRVDARKLAERGALRYETIRGTGWTDAARAMLGRIEAAGWVGTRTDGSGAKFLTATQRAHWAAITADPALADAVQAVVLHVGEHPVAFTLDIVLGDHQYGIASSYDKAFARESPGKLVTYHQFDSAIAQGVRIVDLGAGDSGYKRDIGAQPGSEVVDLLLVRSRATAALLRLRWEGRAGDPDPSSDVPGEWDDAMIESVRRSAQNRDPIGHIEQILLVGMLAATSVALVE